MADPVSLFIANALVMNTGVGLVAAHAVASFIVRTAFSFAIGAVVTSLTKPKLPSFNGLQDRATTVRQPTAFRKMIYGQVRVGGTIVFAHVKGQYLYLVVEWAGHECEEISELWLGDDVLEFSGSTVTGKYANFVTVSSHLGTASQAADTLLTTDLPDQWTSAHRLRGRCYTVFKLRKSAEKFPTGLPNLSAIVKGKKVYDPRTTTTAWSANPALCIADYLCDDEFGLAADYATEIDETALIAAANVCDEDVSLAAGGTEDRYTCNGTISSDRQHREALSDIASSMAGTIIWRHGAWVVNAGAYDTPTITLTQSDLRGPLSIKAGLSRKDLANAVKGVYASPQNLWQPADYPAITNAYYAGLDGGEVLWKELDLPFTTSAATAQRIAKIVLERTRQQISVSVPCRLSALRCIAGGTVMLTYDRMSWSAKPFEIERWSFVTYEQDGAPVLGVDLELREIASTVFEWNSGEETTVDLAPNTNLPSPFSVGSPSNVTAESGSDQLLLMNDGTLLPRIKVSWDEPDDWFTINYEVQYQVDGDVTWRNAATSQEETSVTFGPVVEGETYNLRVRSVSAMGVRSSWRTLSGHVAVGKSEKPSIPDTFNVERQPDGTRQFNWTHDSPDIDVTVGGGYKIRYYLGTTSDWSAMTDLHTGLLNASPWETNRLPAGTYTFAIKTVDSSRNASEDALFVTSTLGDPRLQNVLHSQYDHLDGWPGTLTDCYEYMGKLVADASGTIASLPTTISGLATTIQEMVANVSPIVYETLEIDLGTDVSFTPLVSAEQTPGTGGTFTLKMKTGTSGDGGVTGSWVDLDFVPSARYVQIQVSLAASHPEITQVTVLIDSETKVDRYDDVDTSTESATWFSSIAAGHFRIGSKSGKLASINNAGITALIGTGAGWTWELINKTSTVNGQPAAEFKVYNASGTLADATVDVYLQGPKNG